MHGPQRLKLSGAVWAISHAAVGPTKLGSQLFFNIQEDLGTLSHAFRPWNVAMAYVKL